MFRTHPLDLYEIRSKIACSLKLKDLASCVRVNRDWNDSYSRPLYDSVVLSAHGPSMESIKKNKHLLRTLTIEGNAYETHFEQHNIISIVIARSTLTALIMKGNLLKDSGAQELSEELKTNSSMATLNLRSDMYGGSGNLIGVKGAQALAEALKANKTLATLNLQYNSIGDDGAQALANALKTNMTLTALNLSCNPAGGNGDQGMLDTMDLLAKAMNSAREGSGDQALFEAFSEARESTEAINRAQARTEVLNTN